MRLTLATMVSDGYDATQPFGVSEAFRDAIERISTPEIASSGALLFRQGDPVRGIFLVIDGQVELSLSDAEREYTRVVGPGSVVGLPATMCSKPYSLSARAVDNLRAAFVPADVVRQFLHQRPDLCFEVVEILAREVRGMRSATSEAAAALR